jgi:ribosomal protein S18 acetylase RimI-like enzyme
MTLNVHKFQPGERNALLAIGSETAFFGAPIEAFLDDRRVFEDVFFSYYTDYEPEHAWVASEGEQVVGFLTGCPDTKRHNRFFQNRILPLVTWNWLRGKYHLGKRTLQYTLAILKASLRAEFVGADLTLYPAHLHINLLPAWRGKGLGRGLMEHYLEQLCDEDVVGVHLTTTSYNTAACRLYEAAGFHLLGERHTGMYAHLVNQPIDNRCYGKILG